MATSVDSVIFESAGNLSCTGIEKHKTVVHSEVVGIEGISAFVQGMVVFLCRERLRSPLLPSIL